MNQVAIKEAASIGYPMDHFIGNWWSATESDVVPAGAAAKGYKGATFHSPGGTFPVHDWIRKEVYAKGKGAGPDKGIGEVLYNRGIVNMVYTTEAIRTAMAKFGNKPLTGEQVRWGLEHLNLTEDRLKELGLGGFTKPIHVTCADHETSGPVVIQQWDGKNWVFVSDWISPMRDVVRPLIEQAAAEYAKEKNITPRDCSKEG